MFVSLLHLCTFLIPARYFVQQSTTPIEMLTIKEIKLNDGILIPIFAYCTARTEYQQDCSRCVKRAYLDAGVTHFDTGEMYGNEDSLGRAVRKLEMPREEVVIVTKCK